MTIIFGIRRKAKLCKGLARWESLVIFPCLNTLLTGGLLTRGRFVMANVGHQRRASTRPFLDHFMYA